MRTRMPFSTISFNTPEYLYTKLNELRNAGILSEWFYIKHKPEDDESKGKEHMHVYFIPSKTLQTDDIRNELKEYDPQNPTKPKGTLLMNSSRFGNWFLYAIHDSDYLASKGETRRFHYEYEEIVASDPDILYELYYHIDVSAEIGAFKGMTDAKKRGETFKQFFNQGHVPVQLVGAYQKAWELIDVAETHRGNRLPHAVQTHQGDWIDPVTGEVYHFDNEPENTPQSPENAPQSPESPSWYDVHPRGGFVTFDPDSELPL